MARPRLGFPTLAQNGPGHGGRRGSVSSSSSGSMTPNTLALCIPSNVMLIGLNEIEIKELVGRGTFGSVYRGIWTKKGSSKVVAIKQMMTTEERKAFRVEVSQLGKVDHSNIVKLYGASAGLKECILVLEYADCGNLYKLLHPEEDDRHLHYTLSHSLSWALQAAEAANYLHTRSPKMVHRDLKPPNMLMYENFQTLKLCDFGTACVAQTAMTMNRGSPAWMAPEVIESKNYTETCDVYSWGITLWELITRQKPYSDLKLTCQMIWRVCCGGRPQTIQDCPSVLTNLMNRCWDVDINNRPSMEQVITELLKFYQFCDQPVYPLSDLSDELGTSEYMPRITTEPSFKSDTISSQSQFPSQSAPDNMDFASGLSHPSVEQMVNMSSSNIYAKINNSSKQAIVPGKPSLEAKFQNDNNSQPSSSLKKSPSAVSKGHRRAGSYVDPAAIIKEAEAANEEFNQKVVYPIIQPSISEHPHLRPTSKDDSGLFRAPSISRAKSAIDTSVVKTDKSLSDHVKHTYENVVRKESSLVPECVNEDVCPPLPPRNSPRMSSPIEGESSRSLLPPPIAPRIDRRQSTPPEEPPSYEAISASTSNAQTAHQRDSQPQIITSVVDQENFDAHSVLEPHLQPLQPDPTDQESLGIFEEHRCLAQLFLRLQLEYTILATWKKENDKQLTGDLGVTQIYEKWLKLKEEQQDLVKLREELQGQFRQAQRKRRDRTDGDWVLVDRSNFN